MISTQPITICIKIHFQGIQRRKECQKMCQKDCQNDCQKRCQKECQTECQKRCQQGCQKISYSHFVNLRVAGRISTSVLAAVSFQPPFLQLFAKRLETDNILKQSLLTFFLAGNTGRKWSARRRRRK